MNRREFIGAMSIFPFIRIGKQKIRLDRIISVTFTDKPDKITKIILTSFDQVNSRDIYFDLKSIKDFIKTYDEVVLEDGNKNVLKVNKLNKGLVLLKLDLIK